jgi:hypothetical protein
LALPAADSAAFGAPGALVVTAPVVEQAVGPQQAYSYRGNHRVLLIDLADGHIEDEVRLDVCDAQVTATPDPGRGLVLLDAGMGQDGSRLFTARTAGGKLTVDLLTENVSPPGSIRPALPCCSRHIRASPARSASWTGRRGGVSARIMAADAGVADDRFDLYGCCLTDQTVLLTTRHGSVLVFDGDLVLGGEVDFAGRADAEASMEAMLGTGSDTFATEIWHRGSVVTSVWRLPLLRRE